MRPRIEDYYRLNRILILKHGRCSICGRRLEKGEPLTAGISSSGSMEVACEKCKGLINDKVREMSFFQYEYDVPDGNTKLWRYLDFTKFISLLETSNLFFTRSDRFDDPFEGARGFKHQYSEAYEAIEKFKILEIKTRYQQEGKLTPSNTELQHIVNKEMLAVREKYTKLRETVFISCWHANEKESEGMWKLYTSVLSQGVAITTSVEHLCNSINDPNFQIGKVNYISYEKPLTFQQKPYWYKRDAFKHEQEVRVVILDNTLKEYGKNVSVDLNTMIDAVYVSPTAQSWFADLVEKVCRRYGIDKPVYQSALSDVPLY